MRIVTPLVVAVMLVATSAMAATPEPKTEEQKTLYAIGLALSANLATFELSAADLEMVKAGLNDGVLKKKPKVDLTTYGPKIHELQSKRLALVSDREKKAGKAYSDKVAAEKGVSKTDSGALYSTITPGKGESPKATDTVKVHYQGSLINGTVFDSSVQRGQPATFPLNQVIPCWTEGLQKMKVGEKARLVCPSNTAYGDRGHPPQIPPGATLVFNVELLEIMKPEAPKQESNGQQPAKLEPTKQ
ncbi:MAG: FKBP-type peptidyl-prolyl cis-trans isomerase [Sulfurifustaceae bacterium]